MNLNKQNMRKKEPAEPPMELPKLIIQAIELLIANGSATDKIAEELNLKERDLTELIYNN